MKLTEKIQLERISRVEQLTRAEQAQLAADPEAQALLKENAALDGVHWLKGGETPSRGLLLARAVQAVDDPQEPKEHKMTLINRMFAGKSMITRAAMAGGLVVALLALALFGPFGGSPVSTAWAATDGYVLHFDLGPVTADDAGNAALNEKVQAIEGALREFEETRKAADGEAMPLEIAINVKTDNGTAALEMAIMDEAGTLQEGLMEELRAFYAGKAELPQPAMQPTTWYFDDLTDPFAEDQLTVNFNGHTFSFPHSAGEEAIEEALNRWLAVEFPEAGMKADITMTQEDDRQEIQVAIYTEE